MKRLSVMLLLVLSAAPVFAQEDPPSTNENINSANATGVYEGDTRVKGTLKWSNLLTAGFSLTAGNSDLLNLTAGLKINRNRLWVNEFDFQAAADWRTDSGTNTYLRIDAAFRYGHSFTKKLYGFIGITAYSDYAALIDYNLYPNLGVGFWFFDTKHIKLMNEAGTGYDYSDYQDGTISENWGLYYRLFLEWKITGDIVWNDSFTIKPAWTDFSDFTVNNVTQFKIKLKKNLNLLVTWDYDYDNTPATGAEFSDTTLTTGLEWKF